MEQAKIHNFLLENPKCSFPWFRKMSAEACCAMRQEFCRRLNLPETTDPLTLVKTVDDRQIQVGTLTERENAVELQTILKSCEVSFTRLIYVDWYRFDDLDQMELEAFCDYFDYLWNSGAEDISVYDETVDWIISITHYGALKCLKLP